MAKIGDCMTHQDIGRPMIIEQLNDLSAVCSWSDDDGNPKTGTFALAELQPCVPKDHSAP